MVTDESESERLDWWRTCWLAAIAEDVEPQLVRAHWKANEAPGLDVLLAVAPKIELGKLYAYSPAHLDAGPARRVFDLLSLRGTTPDFVLPLINDELIAQVDNAYQPQPQDRVPPGSTPAALRDFLTEHRGSTLCPFESPDPTETGR